MSRITRMQHKISKLEQHLQTHLEHIRDLKDKYEKESLRKHWYLSKKQHLTEKMKQTQQRIRILKGQLAKQKRIVEEKKQKK